MNIVFSTSSIAALIGVIGMGTCGSISRPTNKVRLMPCSPCASGLPLNLLQLWIGEGDREQQALRFVARYGGSYPKSLCFCSWRGFFLPSIGMLGGACAWLYKPCQGHVFIFVAIALRSSWVNFASIAQSLWMKAIQELQINILSELCSHVRLLDHVVTDLS